MRAAAPIVCACTAVALAACGDGDAEPRQAPPRVRIQIAAPADRATVRAGNVDVRGTVSPATAQVRVLGRPARISAGEFTVVVPLDPGVNVVDVAATARGRSPSLTALRVTREQRVTVPDLVEMDADEVGDVVARLGLRLRRESGGGVLDPLIPRALRVCEHEPAAGSKVRRGTTIRVVVARAC